MMNEGRFRTPNPEIRRASTILFETTAELLATGRASQAGDRTKSAYGLHGTPTTLELERLLLAREGGAGVALSSSGLSAIAIAVLSVVRAGDHLLVTDSAYQPLRELTQGLLQRLGVETEFYDPTIGAGIAALIRPNTSAIWLESPGSVTFEIQDVPAIVAAARAADHRVVTLFDNTYGAGGLYDPFAAGMDIVAIALTKYWGGHSDVVAGATLANAALLPEVRATAEAMGQAMPADDAYLCIRGARTLELRLAAHGAAALELAGRLSGHPRVGRILHPAFPGAPGHELYRRDFAGSNGLFPFELLTEGRPATREEGVRVVDALAARGRFGIGYSWGGFESLALVGYAPRTIRPWEGGALIRLHIGLEPLEELWADLVAGLGA